MPSTLPRSFKHACDVARAAVDLFGVAERDAAFALDPVERFGIRDVIAIVMRDGKADRLALRIPGSKGRGGVLHVQRDIAADEVEPHVAHQRSRQQSCLGQHLETVANAKHRSTGIRRLDHRAHDRRSRRDRTRA